MANGNFDARRQQYIRDIENLRRLKEQQGGGNRFFDFSAGLGGEDVTGGEGRRSKQAFEQFLRFRGFQQRDFADMLSGMRDNPFVQSMQRQVEGLPAALSGNIDRLRGEQSATLDQLESRLTSTATSQSALGGIAAAQSARQVAGGRGGLAFGGGAGALAALGASRATDTSAASLAQALSGAAQARLGSSQQIAGLELQGLLGATSLGTGFAGQLSGQEAALRTALMGNLGSLSGQALQLAFRPTGNVGNQQSNLAWWNAIDPF